MRSLPFLEWLTLRQALRQASETAADEREATARRFQLVRQRAKAADVLWMRGDRAEALRMAADAFEVALEARGTSPHATSPPVRAAERALASRAELEGALRPEHDALFETFVAGRRALEASALGVTTAPSALRRLRALRAALLALGVVALALGAAALVHSPRRVVAAASAYFEEDWQRQPAYAFDGDPSTEWWLPSGRAGWVEARVDPPVEVRSVRVRGGARRSLGAHRVELWRGTEKLTESRADAPGAHDVSARGVDRIRLVVETWPGPGAAVAELDWN